MSHKHNNYKVLVLVLAAISALLLGGTGCCMDTDVEDPVLQVPAPLQIITTSLPYAINGAAYSLCIEAAGGVEPYNWSITANNPPNPITINAATGVLSGIPSDAAGDDTFTVQVLDSATPPATATRDFTITLYDQLQITYAAALPYAVNGEAYGPVTIAASGGTGNYTWSITAGSLPGSLSLDQGNGQLSGTPGDTAGAYAFTVTVQDDATPRQTATLDLSLDLYDPLGIITVSLPNAGVGVAYSAQIETAGGSGDLTWSLSGAPASLTIDAVTGVISGTPVPGDEAGSPYTFTVDVDVTDNVIGASASRNYSVLIRLVLGITTASLPNSYLGATYSETLTAENGVAPLTWSEVGGNLATYGLTLNPDGTITGTAIQAGTCSFTAKVTDSDSPAQEATKTLSISILGITTTTLPDGLVGQPYGPEQLTAAGGTTPYTWSEVGSNLSTYGLTLNPDGTITGTPTQAGTCSFTARAVDSAAPPTAATRDLTVTLYDELQIIFSPPLPDAVEGVAYGPITISAAGGTGNYTWSITAGSLPGGLSLDPNNGQIYGTPSNTAGSFAFTVAVRDDAAQPQTDELNLTINVLGITTTTLPVGVASQPYGPEQLAAAGGTTPYTWSEVASNLATYGLTLNSNGTITGTPTQRGTCSFTAEVTDSSIPTQSAQKALTIEICKLSFVRTWGGTSGEYIYGVAADSGGNIYYAGATSSFGAGSYDALLLKYNASGALQWARTWGGTSADRFYGVAVDSGGNIYCAGATSSFGAGGGDALLLKYDSSGALQWARTWGGTDNEFIRGIALDSAGNVYCAGSTYSFGAGGDAALLLKYNSSGALQWARTWGGTGGERILGVAVDSGGNIYCAGGTTSFGAGVCDALLLKYDSSGALQWARTWGGTDNDWIWGVAVDSSGNIYCADYTYSFSAGKNDALLLKYDASGTLQWARTWGGIGYEYIRGLAVDSGGNIYCVGRTASFGAGSRDALLLKYDTSGILQWARTWGGSSYDDVYGVAVDSGNNIYIGGYTKSYTGVWQTITAGTQRSPAGTRGTPSGSQDSPTGTQTFPAGTEGSPTGSETGAGSYDALLLKNWQ